MLYVSILVHLLKLGELDSILHEFDWVNQILLDHLNILFIFKIECAILSFSTDDAALGEFTPAFGLLVASFTVEAAAVNHEAPLDEEAQLALVNFDLVFVAVFPLVFTSLLFVLFPPTRLVVLRSIV